MRIFIFLLLNLFVFNAMAVQAPFPPWLEKITGDVTFNKKGQGTLAIADDSIVAGDISTGAIGSDEILDSSIASVDIGADVIVAADISTGGVGSDEILDSSIASVDIGADVIVAADISTGGVGSDEILDGAIAEADVADEADGLNIQRFALAVYDFDVNGGSSAAAIELGSAIPDNAILTHCYYDEITDLAGGAAAGIAFQANSAADLMAATSIASISSQGDLIPNGDDASTFVKLTAARSIAIAIQDADLTAGKMRIWCDYKLSE